MIGELIGWYHAVSSFQARLAEEQAPFRLAPEAPERLPPARKRQSYGSSSLGLMIGVDYINEIRGASAR